MAHPKYVLVVLNEAERELVYAIVQTDTLRGSAKHQAELGPILEALKVPPTEKLPREVIERLIVRRLVKDVLAAGYRIQVDDSEGTALDASTDFQKIVAKIFDPAIDDDRYTLHLDSPDPSKPAGWVLLIQGNGWTCISDYSQNLEEVLTGANDFANELEDFDIG